MRPFLYLFFILGGAICAVVFLLMGLEPGLDELLPFVPLPLVIAATANTVMIYKMWDAIAGPEARTSGGAAAGLLWVPFFNIYWIFQVFPGFATDYNRTLAARGLRLPRLPWGLFLCSILLWLIPLVGQIIQAVMIFKICGAVNALNNAETQPVRRRRPPALPAVSPVILDDE